MICCSFDAKVIFTASTFRIWGLQKVQKDVLGKVLLSDGAYCYTVTV